jgi:hypothetical protein
MSDWKPYPGNRKILKKEGYVIVVPASYENDQKSLPLFCDTCEIRLTLGDEDAYKKFLCCSACADTWAYSHKDEWLKGWRPAGDQIKKAVERRSAINRNIRFE